MKKVALVLVCLILINNAFCQKQWIAFSNEHPAPPIVNLIHSTNAEVKFYVEITGMYKQDTVVDSIQYQRISILQNGYWDKVGYPELPTIYKLIAVPDGGTVSIGYHVTDSVVLHDYFVFPAPEIVLDSSNGSLQNVEIFIKNDSVYSLNKYMVERVSEILETSYLRSQKMVRVSGIPFRFNPVTHTLVVYTRFEVMLSFSNPQTDVNVNLGYFSNLAKNTILNFQTDQIPVLPPEPAANPGMVQWITLSDTAEATTISADYLIITDQQFFEPHSQNLNWLANHRASFNGFDVAIVNVQNILNLPFYYSIYNYQNEQKIRSFLKRVYEGGHALNTYDGKLLFVLLVGDADSNYSSTGIPASCDPYPTGSGTFDCYNDYYYSCITKSTNGMYDLNGDFFIGRFCADNEAELFNIVKKTCNYEAKYTFDSWKKNNLLACGGVNPDQHLYFTENYKTWFSSLGFPTYSTKLIDKENCISPWNNSYIQELNDIGANLIIHYGHASWRSWCVLHYSCWNAMDGSLTDSYKKENLNNNNRNPVVISNGCYSAQYADANYDCIGEELTVYSPINGYVAYLGTPILSGLNTTLPGYFPKWFWEQIPNAIFINLSHVLGECILESRLKLNTWGYVSNFEYNLLGDPAVNLMTPGFEITENVELNSLTTISTKVHIRENAVLTIKDGVTLQLEQNGQLIVDPGATLAIGKNAVIKGKVMNNKIVVLGTLVGTKPDNPNPPVPYPLDHVTFTTLPSDPGQPENYWTGIEFKSPELFTVMKNCTMHNCKLTGNLQMLRMENGTVFSNSEVDLNESNVFIDQCSFSDTYLRLTDYHTSTSVVTISNCTFQNSPSDAIIKVDHYAGFTIENNTISYNNGTGIHLSYCGNRNSIHLISNCTIQKSGNPQDLSWGIIAYHTMADLENNNISNNKYGVGLMNLSSIKIVGNHAAQSISQTQQITDNYENQVRSFDNSFPYDFHYNVLENNLSSAPLIYHDQSGGPIPDPDPEDGWQIQNIKCNCFPVNPLFYPSGSFIWQPVWCPPASCLYDEPGSVEYETAAMNFDSGFYSIAETQFKSIIYTYPENKFARESAKKLLALNILTGGDLSALKVFYDTTINLHIDSLTDRLAKRLIIRCDVERKAYTEAINWYEDAILNPYSSNDSVYSIIDLEDTYMIAEADSTLKSYSGMGIGSLTQFKPGDRNSYIKDKHRLISSLFKESSQTDTNQVTSGRRTDGFILFQNKPNPFSSETEITFIMPHKAYVSIVIKDYTGRLITTIPESNLEKGQHDKKINLTGISGGVYIIILYANGREVARIKCIKI